jgi:hypothetical protein
MTPEKQQILFDRYPTLFAYARKESQHSIALGITCNDGWFDLIDTLCATLDRLVVDRTQRRAQAGLPEEANNIRVVQIKEKFGSLRFYVAGVPASGDEPNAVYTAIWLAETLSSRICESCGAPAKLDGEHGWWRTECGPCQARRRA